MGVSGLVAHDDWEALARAITDGNREVRIAAATGLATGYRTEETLVVAADAADARSLSDLASHQIASGMDVEEISTREARSMEPALAPRLGGPVRILSDRQVDPRMLAAALVETLNCPHLTTIGDVPDAGPAQWLTSRVDTVLTSRREPRQATGVQVASQLLSMLPYVATIVVLALISRNPAWIRANMPASLGKPFTP